MSSKQKHGSSSKKSSGERKEHRSEHRSKSKSLPTPASSSGQDSPYMTSNTNYGQQSSAYASSSYQQPTSYADTSYQQPVAGYTYTQQSQQPTAYANTTYQQPQAEANPYPQPEHPWQWGCCRCGTAGQTVYTDYCPGVPPCGHLRCEYCSVFQ